MRSLPWSLERQRRKGGGGAGTPSLALSNSADLIRASSHSDQPSQSKHPAGPRAGSLAGTLQETEEERKKDTCRSYDLPRSMSRTSYLDQISATRRKCSASSPKDSGLKGVCLLHLHRS